MTQSKIIIVNGKEITGFNIDNVEYLKLEIQNGSISVDMIERRQATIQLSKEETLQIPKLPKSITNTSKRTKNNNEGKMTFDNFKELYLSYISVKADAKPNILPKLFSGWSEKLGINSQTLRVWITTAYRYMNGSKKAKGRLNSWVTTFCEQYKKSSLPLTYEETK